MRIRLKCLLLTTATVVAGAGLTLVNRATAQTLTTLYTFGHIGGPGTPPISSLVLSGNVLYGSTPESKVASYTVFSINTAGSNFTTLYAASGPYPIPSPHGSYGSLILSGNTLYGTISFSDRYSYGAVFALNTNGVGSGFHVLHTFMGARVDGMIPNGLILSGNRLYGTTLGGWGTVFAMNTDGTGFTNLYVSTNYDNGDLPNGNLVLSGKTLYGTMSAGGSNDWGTVFALNTNGTYFSTLYTFSGGSDGGVPSAGLILAGDTLYGTTWTGGLYGNGTVFSINTDGTCFTTLHSFSPLGTNSLEQFTNSDGAQPADCLILSSNTLYGTANGGGRYGWGTVFSLKTNGTDFTTWYSFAAGYDGLHPVGGLVLSSNTLYGTTSGGGGGYGANGTVFSLTQLPPPAPPLAMTRSGSNAILTWPGNANGFALQWATNLVPPVVWSDVPVRRYLINGGNCVTNPIGPTPTYFRLGLQQ